MELSVKPIAYIKSDFSSKFGIPRQSGLVDELEAKIIIEKEYSSPDAFRGLEGYSHIWLLWLFSECAEKEWSPTVRPPRLGGNKRMGVFASRSPFRPNSIGLSCVKLVSVKQNAENSTVLTVRGADLLDGTPIIDIKPYLPYVDSHPEASGGFALQEKEGSLEVRFPEELIQIIPQSKQEALKAVLKQDPRPQYQNDPERVYGLEFAGFNIRFRVDSNILEVVEVKSI